MQNFWSVLESRLIRWFCDNEPVTVVWISVSWWYFVVELFCRVLSNRSRQSGNNEGTVKILGFQNPQKFCPAEHENFCNYKNVPMKFLSQVSVVHHSEYFEMTYSVHSQFKAVFSRLVWTGGGIWWYIYRPSRPFINLIKPLTYAHCCFRTWVKHLENSLLYSTALIRWTIEVSVEFTKVCFLMKVDFKILKVITLSE